MMDNKVIKLQILDTAGQERFQSVTSSYYQHCDGAVIVYDVTDENSFRSVDHWVEELYKTTGENIYILLVANKCDLKQRIISKTHGEKKAQELNCKYIETSAITAQNVDNAFFEMGKSILTLKTTSNLESLNDKSTILIPGKEIKKSCC